MIEHSIHEGLFSIGFYYLAEILLLFLCIFFCIREVLKNHPGSDRFGYLTIALTVLTVIQLCSAVSFLQDCLGGNISTAQGIYKNPLGAVSKSPSSMIGMDSVTLIQDAQEFHLTTYPFNEDRFPAGSYEVIAYYTQKSEFLLHIEIISNITEP